MITMMAIGGRQEHCHAATTDPAVLSRHAYATDRDLAVRQSLYAFQQASYDLPTLVNALVGEPDSPVIDVGCGNDRYVDRLRTHSGRQQVIDLPGTITVTRAEPVVAHLASYRPWAAQAAVPFDATIARVRERLTAAIDRDGTFRIIWLGAILSGHTPAGGRA